jgi:hypothetical protein
MEDGIRRFRRLHPVIGAFAAVLSPVGQSSLNTILPFDLSPFPFFFFSP